MANYQSLLLHLVAMVAQQISELYFSHRDRLHLGSRKITQDDLQNHKKRKGKFLIILINIRVLGKSLKNEDDEY